jgi:hypothetical protein
LLLVIALLLGARMMTRPVLTSSSAAFAGVLPIQALTPGAVAEVDAQALCAARVTSRPAIAASVREAVLRDYRMTSVSEHEYELDYLITPELGGIPDARNLWPERYDSKVWNARVKDDLERLLPQMVCEGRLDLRTAQRDIADNWIAAYQKYFHTQSPMPMHADLRDDDDQLHVSPRGASQVLDHRTRGVRSVRERSRALRQVAVECAAKFLQLDHPRIEIGQLALQEPLDLLALIRPPFAAETQQFANLREGQAVTLRLLDEPQPIDDGCGVDTKSTRGARDARDHAKALVVAEPIRRHAGASGQLADRQPLFSRHPFLSRS